MCVCPLLLLLILFMYAREEAVSHGHIPVNAEGRDEPSAAAVRVLGILPLVFHRLTTHPSPFWSKSKAFHWFCEGWNSSFSPVFFLSPTNISDSLTRTAAPLFCSSDFNDSIRHSSIFFFRENGWNPDHYHNKTLCNHTHRVFVLRFVRVKIPDNNTFLIILTVGWQKCFVYGWLPTLPTVFYFFICSYL